MSEGITTQSSSSGMRERKLMTQDLSKKKAEAAAARAKVCTGENEKGAPCIRHKGVQGMCMCGSEDLDAAAGSCLAKAQQ